jgi:hypothetical protein
MRVAIFLFLLLITVALSLATFLLACYTGDFHLPMRVGASIVAVAGFFVVFQFALDREIEDNNAIDQEFVEKPSSSVPLGILQRVVAWRKFRRLLARRNALILMALSLAVGESLHGWGDLLAGQICTMNGSATESAHL